VSTTGRLVYMTEPGHAELRDFQVPSPGPGALVATVTRANVCGSDLHIWRGLHPTVKRGAMGHEMVGRVSSLGEGVSTDHAGQPLASGDRISVVYFQACRRCRACQYGQFNLCENAYRHWVQPPENPPHFNATYATHYYVNPDQYVYRVPDNVPDAVASFANCALSQVYYGAEVADITAGQTVVVQGAGGLGLSAIAVCKQRGARVIAVDAVADRLEAAQEFGADALVDMRSADTAAARIERVRDATGGYGADVGIEVTGVPDAFGEGAQLVRPGGRFVTIGNISPGQMTTFDPGLLTRRQVQILPVIRYQPWFLLQALELLSRTIDQYPWRSMVDADFPLDAVEEALAKSARREVRRASLVMD
jgi:threonine dehydrogenase-like Zn-dependent dehydrogenase